MTKPIEILEIFADRWQYLRDVIWKDVKRDDLPEPMRQYFYDICEEKYPRPDQLDDAMDYLIDTEDEI